VEALEKLEALREKKLQYVSGPYETVYVLAKIAPDDIQIMKANDESPKALLERLKDARNKG
jgi:hypothetical protein